MKGPLDLKNLERKAWTSYFQDGLWDMYLGVLLATAGLLSYSMALLDVLWIRLLAYFATLGGAWLLFWAGRRFLTLPRLGRARFGAERRQRKATLRRILAGFVALTLLLMAFTVAANNHPDTWGRYLPGEMAMPVLIGALVGSIMMIMAYFNDFSRGFYIALVYTLTFTAAELLTNPAIFWIGAALVFIPGLVLLVRFLLRHPLPPSEVIHDQPES